MKADLFIYQKLIIIITAVLLFTGTSYSQQPPLVSMTEKAVRKYMDSLFSLKQNKYYKIEEGTNSHGDLLLTADFSLYDFDFYNCNGMMVTFQRINGIEICTKHIIYGEIKFAQLYLSFIKDHFKFVSDNIWETPYDADNKLTIEAEYKKMNDTFAVIYSIKEVK